MQIIPKIAMMLIAQTNKPLILLLILFTFHIVLINFDNCVKYAQKLANKNQQLLIIFFNFYFSIFKYANADLLLGLFLTC